MLSESTHLVPAQQVSFLRAHKVPAGFRRRSLVGPE
jgi:hypothetical protein